MKTTNGLQFKFAGGGDNNAIIEGYAARFGERDLGGDVIEAGAFTKTIAEIQASGHRLPMLWAHGQEDVVGSWMDLRQDAAGLYAIGSINTQVERGREALALVKGGDLSGMSIGYDIPPGGRYVKDGVRHLTEVRLLEISLVAVPMASNARIVLKELTGFEDMAEALRSGRPWSRREAEFVARKSWPAIKAGDQPEIDFDRLAARIEATTRAVKTYR